MQIDTIGCCCPAEEGPWHGLSLLLKHSFLLLGLWRLPESLAVRGSWCCVAVSSWPQVGRMRMCRAGCGFAAARTELRCRARCKPSCAGMMRCAAASSPAQTGLSFR